MVPQAQIRVRGQVQGVGFRPFVWRLARSLGASGDVRNDAQGVLIRLAGVAPEHFVAAMRDRTPPLARIDAVEITPCNDDLPRHFEIVMSAGGAARTRVAPDAATCPACVDEIRGTGRRRAYAFTNCTDCGPRFTIIRTLPYDRATTTMAPFAMCPDCRAEYEDPGDRRFHAQPLACAACGPQLALDPPATDPLAGAVATLLAGGIVAVKGLGGYHLACDATDAAAVARLRQRKRRPSKPLALMATLPMIRRHAAPTADEVSRLADPAAPIVLLDRRDDGLPASVAPGAPTIGWMLPYTPLHHLLLDGVDRPLVMTSANTSGAPQIIDDTEARTVLGPVVDAILSHDRKIARRLDDSVERITAQGAIVLRHARGRAPGTLPLPAALADAPAVTGFGGQLKSALCLARDGRALLTHHLGDLDDARTLAEFGKAEADYAALFDHAPVAVACDTHPDYASTRLAERRGLPIIRVQHHHAHLAACLAENGWDFSDGPVAGIVLDGTGLGEDGTIWGGELLVGDYAGYRRAAWLKPTPLPGGEAAALEPWRNLLARLDAAGLAGRAETALAGRPVALLREAIAAGLNAPLSSSAGRLFDAAAAAAGVAPERQSYEGEAAMALETLALRGGRPPPLELPMTGGAIDPAPLFRLWAEGTDPPEIFAARVHATIARAFAVAARAEIDRGAARAVALSGGCFQNALLLDLVHSELADLPVLIHTRVPPNDGGLALGQVVVALARLESS